MEALVISVSKISCLRPDSGRDNSSRFLGTPPRNWLQVILNVNFSFHQKPDHLLALPAFHNLFCCQSLRLAFKFMSIYKSPRSVLLGDRKSTRLNSSHVSISYAVFCLKKKKTSNKDD